MQVLTVGLFAGTAAAAASTGCGKALPSTLTAGGYSQYFNFTTTDNTARKYKIYIPYQYNSNVPAPLILSFHGAGGNGASQEAGSGFSDKAHNPGSIVVYPDGISSSWQSAPYAVAGVDDINFVAQLVKYISATYCVDPNRIYANGQSNGGGFTGHLACNETTSTIFAAFGSHSGAFYPGHGYTGSCSGWTADVPPCKPSRKAIPFIEIHGDADGQIPYIGGDHNNQCMPAVPLYMTNWAIRDGYGSSNVTTSYYNGNVTKYEFGKSAGNGVVAPVTHYKIAGLGHTWPFNYGPMKWSSSPVFLDFFSNWTLTGPVAADPASSTVVVASATPSTSSSVKSSATPTLSPATSSATTPASASFLSPSPSSSSSATSSPPNATPTVVQTVSLGSTTYTHIGGGYGIVVDVDV